MKKVRFGKTGMLVSQIALGGIPIQRLNQKEAVEVLRGSIDLGVNFIDTANGYADSEEKIGLAIKGLPRENLVIATKSLARDKKTFTEHIDLSLQRLGTDYIDLYQLHHVSNAAAYEQIFGAGGAYAGLVEAMRVGKVRFPAFSSHNVGTALRVMKEQDLAAVQLPFNFVDQEALKEAIPLAIKLNMGFIAMKPLGGGLLDNANLAIKYLMQFESVVPDPGIERLSEMVEIVSIVNSGEKLTAVELEAIEAIRKQTTGSWCHRCDYCQPCPEKINISQVLALESLIKRMTRERVVAFASKSFESARGCTECGECIQKCPYNLEVPKLIKDKLAIWDEYLSQQ